MAFPSALLCSSSNKCDIYRSVMCPKFWKPYRTLVVWQKQARFLQRGGCIHVGNSCFKAAIPNSQIQATLPVKHALTGLKSGYWFFSKKQKIHRFANTYGIFFFWVIFYLYAPTVYSFSSLLIMQFITDNASNIIFMPQARSSV